MKVYIKELAWKVPVCVAWIQCTPWINDGSLTYWDQLIICFSFILSLDLIRWGLRKDKGPADKEDQQPSTGNTVVPRLQDINVDKLVSEYCDSLLPHVNALCHKGILEIATWSYRQGVEEMIEKQGGHTDKIVEKAKIEKQRVLVTESDGSANIDWNTRSLKDAKKLLECGLQYVNTELEKQGKQRFDWSKEDSMMIEETLFFLREYQQSNRCKDENGMQNSVSCEKWLKSLKERVTWKPSKEQIIALRWVLNNVPYNKHKEEISGLLDQIKDL